MGDLINPQPRLLSSTFEAASPPPLPSDSQEALRDELYSLVRRINDPEHPHTLEELGVVSKQHIWFRASTDRRHDGSEAAEREEQDEEEEESVIELTPTVPHCSLVTTIGLCVRHKVESAIPNIKLAVLVRQGTHRTATESQTTTTARSTAQHSPHWIWMSVRCHSVEL